MGKAKQVDKIIITGAAGFIGYHLCLTLKKQGLHPIGLDNFEPFYDPALKELRATLLQKAGIPFHPIPVQSVAPLIESENPSHIIHLAAQAGVRHSLTHPEKYIDANIGGMFELLEILRYRPDIPLIYASSSSVYGHNKKIPFEESDPVTNPANLYAATKISDEILAKTYHNLFGLTAIGLRFFTVYGPLGRPDMAYYSFAEKIEGGLPIKLFNHGVMERDFTYIDDIIDGIVAALENAEGCTVYNLGKGHPEKLMTLVDLLAKGLGKTPLLEKLPMQPGEIPTTFASIEKAKQQLGYNPQIALEEGIEKFLMWYKAHALV